MIKKPSKGFNLRLALLSAVLLAATLLSSCRDSGGVKNGITVEPAPHYTYSDSSLAYAEELLFSILYEIEAERGGAVSSAKSAELRESAGALVSLGANGKISEEKYFSLIRTMYSERTALARALLGKAPLSSVERVWRTFTDTAGRDYSSELLFELMISHFEKERKDALDAYEKDGAPYQLVLAERQTKNITALNDGIGKENLAGLIDYAFLLSEIALNPSFDSGAVRLTDGEVLLLLTYLDPADLTLSAEGWELVFTLSADTLLLSGEPSFLRKMHFAAAKNGDAAELSLLMSELISLIRSVQSRLDTDAVALIRSCDREALITEIVRGFEAEDFDRLDRLLSVGFENLEYSTLAHGYYGEPYGEYLEDLRTYTKDELVSTKDTDALYDTLKGYIAGKCPALSYAIFMEND